MSMDDAEIYAEWLNDLKISMKLLDPSEILSLEKSEFDKDINDLLSGEGFRL